MEAIIATFIISLVILTSAIILLKAYKKEEKADQYSVYYRSGIIWKKIKDVIEDGFVVDRATTYAVNYQMRYFIRSDGSALEIPASYQFKFPAKRKQVIEENRKKAELERMKGENQTN